MWTRATHREPGNRTTALLGAACVVLAFVAFSAFAPSLSAQPASTHLKKPNHKLQAANAGPKANAFAPTCNLDSNSIGYYFFPPNLGAKWTMRTISQILDGDNHIVKIDTQYSWERVISDSNRTLQGLPELICESSYGYRLGEQPAKTQEVAYYLDDSVIMSVLNHSILNEMNHTFLMNPLKVGNSWRDSKSDTIRSQIVSIAEPVTVPVGSWNNAVVVRTGLSNSELSKYFVPGVGLVKAVYRGVPPTAKGTYVVTSELFQLDRGDERRSIKYRFGQMANVPQ